MSSQIEIKKNIIKYLSEFGFKKDTLIKKLIIETQKLGRVAKMQISAEQAKFLELITKLISAKKCLEVGRFTGLSSLSIARSLPKNGQIITIDNSDEFTDIAQKYWKRAKVYKKIKSINGNGIDTLNYLISKNNCFDLIFIDADKSNYPKYYELSLKLLKKNGLLLIDNVLWDGEVTNLKNGSKVSKILHLLNKKIANDKRVDFVLLPLADGISLIRKK